MAAAIGRAAAMAVTAQILASKRVYHGNRLRLYASDRTPRFRASFVSDRPTKDHLELDDSLQEMPAVSCVAAALTRQNGPDNLVPVVGMCHRQVTEYPAFGVR